ncbi:MAG: site-specific DNA-methyltransferase [Candidatus Nealsonbacteria bacterium]|nr:site-specific DNA-methyltransferase [Candidatus Nealsonbacteria bacterium]
MDGRARLDELCDSLGDPYARGDRYAVFCGDALSLMGRVKPDAFDLTVTSPPYNIGKEYEDPRPLEEYLNWCEQWMGGIHRITHPRGAFWLNVGYLSIPEKAKALPLPYLLWDRNPFFLVQEVVWNYGAGVAARKSLSPRNEKFLWYVKDPDAYTFNLDAIRDPDVKYPNQKKNKRLRCNTIGKNPSDVWRIAKVTSGRNRASAERAPHPAQFPLDLIDRVVLGFSNPEDLVLDPFLGSGTTAVSCVRNGRFVVGIEIQESYCECAADRIEAELQAEKSRLFVY